MTHDEAYVLMMDALDGTLIPADSERLDEHLLLCRECYSEWQALQMVDGLLANAPLLAAPEGFSQRLQARMAHPSWSRAFSTLFALSVGSVVALILIAVPAAAVLLGIWTVFNEPASFSRIMVWLNQLVGVSGSLFSALWTALRLFFAEFASNPLTLLWTLGTALVLALWARLLRPPELAKVRNGYGN
jgi:predicted anti-sigma-YlaC factor YlaD